MLKSWLLSQQSATLLDILPRGCLLRVSIAILFHAFTAVLLSVSVGVTDSFRRKGQKTMGEQVLKLTTLSPKGG
jgi:hypothetical protein